MPHSGSCLCGQTKISIASTHENQIYCHCTDCQKTSGSHASTNILPEEKDVKFEGPVKEYPHKLENGNIVTRFFCSGCGSALAHKSKVFGDAIAVQTGNLDGFNNIPINTELFTKSRWSGIPEIKGAEQAYKMPGSSKPE